jgi:3-methyladenine DNA glycosylase Tag
MSDVIPAAPAAPTEAVVADPSAEAIAAVDESIEDDGADLGLTNEEDAIDDAVKAGTVSKAQAKEMKKVLKLKVDGQDIDFEEPTSDEEKVRHYQKAKAFDKKAQEAAQMKAQMDQLVQMLQNDPEGLLEKLGLDVDGLAEKRLSRRVEEMKKTPAEIEAEKMRKELEDFKKREKEATERAQMAEQERMRNQAATQIENDISSALESSNSYLPKDKPWVLRNIAQYMYLAATNGYPEVTAKDVLPLVEKEYLAQIQDLIPEDDDKIIDRMERILGKQKLDKYRKSIIQKTRKSGVPTKPRVQDTGASKGQQKQTEPEKFRMKDVFSIRPSRK